jgi:hypothetical protein
VCVSGYLRGGNMSANQLVHLPGLGDFQLKKVYKKFILVIFFIYNPILNPMYLFLFFFLQIEMLSDPNPVGRPRVHDNADEVFI